MKMINISKMVVKTQTSRKYIDLSKTKPFTRYREDEDGNPYVEESVRETSCRDYFVNPLQVVSVEAASYEFVPCTRITLTTGETISTNRSVESIINLINTYC